MTHGNGLPLAFVQLGVASDLKGVAATPPHESRHQLGGRPGPPEREGRGGAPAAAMTGSLQVAKNPHICSDKSLVPGLCAVPPPQLGTHSPGGAVDRR
jgi:hypothetical protein